MDLLELVLFIIVFFMNEENPLNDIPMRVDAFKLESKGKTRYVYLSCSLNQ